MSNLIQFASYFCLMIGIVWLLVSYRPTQQKPWRVNWYWWNFFVRPVVSVLAGAVLPGLLWALDYALSAGFMGISLFLSATLVLATYFAWPSGEKELIPTGRMALLTIGGSRIPVFLLEGKYDWFLRSFIDRARQILVPFTDDAGLFYQGQVTFQLWNHGDEPQKTTLSNIGADDAKLFVVVTLALTLVDAFKAINVAQSPLQFGEGVREALRKVLNFFIASDNGSLIQVHPSLMMGATWLASFLADRLDHHPKKSIARDTSDVPLIYKVGQGGETETLRQAKNRYLELVRSRTDLTIEGALAKNRDGSIQVTQLHVGDKLPRMAERVGVRIDEIAVSDFSNNEQYQALADRLASEGKQLAAQASSATSIANAMRIIDAQLAEGTELAAAIAAALDEVPGVNINILGGKNSNPVTDAGAIIGAQLGGNTP